MHADQLIRTIEIRDRNGRVTGTKDVVTYQGLLSRAHDEGLKRVATELVQAPSEANERTAITKATVETEKGVFEALGDASPENVNSFIVPHLIRMAETRAKARALRDAVNVGILSAEELLGEDAPAEPELPEAWQTPSSATPTARNGRNRGRQAEENPNSSARADFIPMTDNQRRYMFRILATQGFHGDAAQDALKTRFAIKSLDRVSKADAVSMIAQLLDETGSDSHATPQR
jgi:hypothetical protein